MIAHLFTLAFVILKLTGFISWSWWLVLAPSYIGLLIVLVLAIIAAAAR